MSARPNALIPPAHSFAVHVVLALRELGGSGGIEEINEAVVALADLSEEQQAIPRGQGRTEVEYRLAWARTLVKHLGLVENSARGVWTLTREGWQVDEEEIEERKRAARQARARARRSPRSRGAGPAGSAPNQDETAEPLEEVASGADGPDEEDLAGGQEQFSPVERLDVAQQAWKEHLLEVLKTMEPAAFERLCQRLLREAGFTDVHVTGGPGDGGIDGTGVYRVSLISFPIFFQAKRYAKTVSSAEVRNFRGAMTGRGDRGLLITTGAFTTNARAEATRDGAPPVDLIDGQTLAELLREHAIGVTTTTRTVHDVTIEPAYFTDL